MDAEKIANADYLDILFDNRNKLYGGYVLRKTENNRMIKALLIMSCFILAFCIWTFIDTHEANTNPSVTQIEDRVHEFKDIRLPIEPPKPPQELPKEMASAKPSIKNPVPVIAPDDIVKIQPPAVDSFAGRESGPTTNAGKTDGCVIIPKEGTGNGKEIVQTPVEPITYAEEMPAFQGDIYVYLAKSVRYPRSAIENGVEGRVIISFVVNEDGHISNAVVKRGIGAGCDEEGLRVVNNMPAWKPGRQNGRAVKVYYTLPINFKLQ